MTVDEIVAWQKSAQEFATTPAGAAMQRFERALATSWATEGRESVSLGKERRDRAAADAARNELRDHIKLLQEQAARSSLPAPTSGPLFERMSDEDLRANGWDPEWIQADEEREGPYAVIRAPTDCPCCGHSTFGWTVLNLATGSGIADIWTHDEAETDAQERAQDLNDAWLEGARAAMPRGKAQADAPLVLEQPKGAG